MKITKFFRRYTKVLLMVFMSLLLVVFLIGDVLQQMASRWRAKDQEIGHAFGDSLNTSDIRRTQANMQIYAQLGLLPGGLDVLDVHLLLEEARRMGIHVGLSEVDAELSRISEAGRIDAGEVLSIYRRRQNRGIDSLKAAIGEWLAVGHLFASQTAALNDSPPRVELAYRDYMQEATVKLSVIDSNAFVASVPEPTEEELTAFFEEAKNREDVKTEEQLEYGYLQPDRIQVEYLTIDPKRIEDKIIVRALKAKRFFEDNRNHYKKDVPRPTPPGSTQPSTEFDTVQLEYDEVAEKVRNDCRAVEAISEAQRVVNEMREEARRAWETMEFEEDGYRAAPPADRIISFEALQKKYADQYGYDIQYHKTRLLDSQELANDRRFGQATYVAGVERVPSAGIAMRVKGLYTPQTEESLPLLNLNEPGPVVLDRLGRDPLTERPCPYRAYLFRVIAVKPSGPPESLEIVREDLTEDLKKMKAHELAKTHAERVEQRAREAGLDAAVTEEAELKTLFFEQQVAATTQPVFPKPKYADKFEPATPTGRFTRMQTYTRHAGRSTILPEAVFELAEQPADEGARRVVLVQNAGELKWIVAELEEVKPVYAGEFASQRDQLAMYSRQAQMRLFMQDWFDSEMIRQRTGYQPRVFPEQSEEPTDAEG